ncbi:MAG: recombinase family protein [Candidatus Riflebacteria bacterium]|nr:recombinase family protein [Candidatus Riflebacteria bacterium]
MTRGRSRQVKPMPPRAVPAVLYARVSSMEQAKEGFSIDAQLRLLKEYAQRQGLCIPPENEFQDVETAKVAGRKNFGKMLEHLRGTPDCRVVLVEKTDRLYRNLKDWVTLDELNIEIHFVKEGVVLSKESRSGEKFIHGIKVLMAKNYIDNLREETQKGMLEKAEQGIWPSAAPFGYKNVLGANGKKTIVQDLVLGPALRRLFEWYATGRYSLLDLGRLGQEAGLGTRRTGSRLPRTTLHRLLRNPIYAGTFEWTGKTYRGTYEPLVSQELFDKVQDVLDGRHRGERQWAKHDFAFSGLIQCGHCGCALVGDVKKGKYVYYRCSGNKQKCPEPYVRQEVLEAQYAEVIKGLTFDQEILDWLRVALRESHQDEKRLHDEAVARLQAQQARLQNRIDAMYVDKLDGKIDAAFFDKKATEWRREQEQVVRAISDHMTANQNYLDEGVLLLELAQKAHQLFIQQIPSEKRRLLDFVCSNSTWANGALTVSYRKPFSLIASAASAAKTIAASAGAETAKSEVWYPIPTANYAPATFVVGQVGFLWNNYNKGFGAGSPNAGGFHQPRGVCMYGSRFWVADHGNSRVMQWNALPVSNGASCTYVIGKADKTSNGWECTQGGTGNTEDVSTESGGVFVLDGNNRLLRWDFVPAADGVLAAGRLGQPSHTANAANNGGISGARLYNPWSVCATSSHVFVADMYNNRVLIWNHAQPSSGSSADVVLGQPDMVSSQDNNPGVSASICGSSRLASDGTRLFVADGTNNRVLIWDSLPSTSAQPATRVLGQTNFTSKTVNSGGLSASSLDNPEGLAVAGGKLFVSDRGNHRVLVWNSLPASNKQAADLVLGQPSPLSNTANNGGLSAAGMSSPRGLAASGGKLVVADANNHRVLLWNSFPVTNTVPANVVLGQPSGLTNTANNGGLSASTLYSPQAVATDGTKLAVADCNNHRVLLWNGFPTSHGQPADVVLGQPNPISNTANNGGLSAASLNGPYGVAWDGRKLYVADRGNNRVLVWNGWPTANGASADSILGQDSWAAAVTGGPSPGNLVGPVDVAVTPGLVWIVDATPRVVKFQAEYFEVTLAYDQADRFYRAEPFVVTATFGTVPVGTPTSRSQAAAPAPPTT